MKNFFWMNCQDVMNVFFESEKDSSLPILTQIRLGFHLLFCPDCAFEQKNLQFLKEIMETDFFPPAPELEDHLMIRIHAEAALEGGTGHAVGFSFRGWVIIGFFMLLSLASSFFGMNFIKIANAEGLSFLLPVGLTIGMVLTCYGALFIGSHLKELSARFGLR